MSLVRNLYAVAPIVSERSVVISTSQYLVRTIRYLKYLPTWVKVEAA